MRRLAGLVGGVAGVTTVLSLVFGVLLGAELRRALAVGFYVSGCILVVVGFFFGVRPPVRTTGEGPPASFLGSLAAGGGTARWATADDLKDSLSASAVFVFLGLLMIAIGVLVDPRDRLL